MDEFGEALLRAFVSCGVPGDDALDYVRAIEEEVEELAHGEGDTGALKFRVTKAFYRLGKSLPEAHSLTMNAFIHA